MAKIRTIKPSMTTDEKLAEVSIPARHLFTMALMFVDDAGRMEYSPKRLKMQVFPGDRDRDLDINPLVAELCELHLFVVYEIEGRKHLCIPNFLKHQRIHKPTPSTLLGPPNGSTRNKYFKAGEKNLPEEKPGTTGETGKKCEELEVELNLRNGMEGEGSKTPPGMTSPALARGLLENIGYPITNGNLWTVVASIDSIAKLISEPPNVACDWLHKCIIEDREAGIPIDRFYFEDAKYGDPRTRLIERPPKYDYTPIAADPDCKVCSGKGTRQLPGFPQTKENLVICDCRFRHNRTGVSV